ncbi:GntR family putative transcriptional regulator [Lentilactobacillus farraginis DSM 18382 = JCM 14108]|nr:GntR family putative transcriptional regulator [Lentilactobacillus farraginis DSM 18382 = JCM 14108]
MLGQKTLFLKFCILRTLSWKEKQHLMLERANIAPLYLQIRNKIIEEINTGVYAVGTQIPPEQELEKAYDVSRITIRRAINDLVNSGYLVKKQGKGTFVLNHKMERNLLSLNSYTEFMLHNEEVPKREIISLEKVQANENISKLMNIKRGDWVVRLARTMTFEPRNKGYEITYYPASRFPGLELLVDQDSSVSKILQQKYQVQTASNHKVLNLVTIQTQVAALMGLAIGSDAYKLEKVARDRNKQTIYYSIMYYDPRKFSFVIDD